MDPLTPILIILGIAIGFGVLFWLARDYDPRDWW